MDKRRGFTIVELMIVIVIMATLLVVGVVSYRGYSARARDKERESDIAAIQMYLESIYPMELKNSAGSVIKKAGSYPALIEERDETDDDLSSIFDDLDSEVKSPPSGGYFTWAPSGSSGYAPYLYIPRDNRDSTIANECRVSYTVCYARPDDITASMVGENYVYASGQAENQLCTMLYSYGDSSKCRRYTLYYRTEVDGVLHKVESKHR